MGEPFEIPADESMDPAHVRDPYPQLERIRARCPIAHEPAAGNYLLVSHAGVERVLRDISLLRDPRRAAPGTRMARMLENRDPGMAHNMLFLDPPEHTRLRGLVRRSFTPRAVERLSDRIHALTETLLDEVAGRARFDLMEALARPLPTIVIAELLGVDPADHERFKRWSDQSIRGFDPFLSESERLAVVAARDEFSAHLHALLEARRAQPREDLVSELVAAQNGDDRLTDDEIVVTCRLLLAAGNVTTTDLIGNGLLALLRHPDQLALLRAEPERIDNAVEEVLRYQSPVVFAARIAAEDMELHGCPIAAGESIFVSLAGANRDPDAHRRPNEFDITRADTQHHAFGGGLHFCLGAHLARVETRIAIARVVARFPTLRLPPDFQECRSTTPGFHGLEALPVEV